MKNWSSEELQDLGDIQLFNVMAPATGDIDAIDMVILVTAESSLF